MSKEQERQPQYPFTLDEIVRTAKEDILREGAHAPTIIVEGSLMAVKGEFTDLPASHEDKVQRMRSAGFMMGQAGNAGELMQVFFISEGWLSTMQKDKPPITPPSKDPNRKEVLLITHLALLEERSELVCIEMIRNTQGRLVALKNMIYPEEAKEGHFDSPLLMAFVDGFLRGSRRGGN